MVFHRHKSKTIDLKLQDSNYRPAPNPNSLKPQPATGGPGLYVDNLNGQPHASPMNSTPPLPPYPAGFQQQQQQFQQLQNRPIPPTPNMQRPTVINNYYVVAPSSTAGQLPIQVPQQQYQQSSLLPQQQTQHRPLPPQQQPQYPHGQQQHPQQQQYSQQQQYQYNANSHLIQQQYQPQQQQQQPPMPKHQQPQTDMSYSKQQFINLARTATPNGAQLHSDQQPTSMSPQRDNGSYSRRGSSVPTQPNAPSLQGSMRSSSHHSLGSRPYNEEANSNTNYNHHGSPPGAASIYSRASLIKSHESSPRIPEIDFDTYRPSSRASRSSESERKYDLVKELSRIQYDDLTPHNTRLLEIFRTFARDSIGYKELNTLLFNPNGGRRFRSESTKKMCLTFKNGQYPNDELDFAGFIKLGKFIRGCYDSFVYHDYDKSNKLELDEFEQALISSSIQCPAALIRNLFNNESGDLNFERYIVAVIVIRIYQKEAASSLKGGDT